MLSFLYFINNIFFRNIFKYSKLLALKFATHKKKSYKPLIKIRAPKPTNVNETFKSMWVLMLIKKKIVALLINYMYIYSRTFNFLIKHESFKIFVVRRAQINWSISIEDNCTVNFTYIKFIFWPISKSKKKL